MTAESEASLQPAKPNWLARFGACFRDAFALLRRQTRPMPPRFAVQFTLPGVVICLLVMICIATWQSALIDKPMAMFVRQAPAWLRAVAGVLTNLGSGGFFLWPLSIALVILAVVAATLQPSAMTRRMLAMVAIRLEFLFIAIGAPSLFVTIVKRLIGRARPFVGGDVNAFNYHPFSWSASYASMPSGHSVTIFSALVAVGAVWPRMRPIMWAAAVIVAATRVVLSAHYPSDVMVGAVVGIGGALLVRNMFAARRLVFRIADDGMVEAKPGPSWRRAAAGIFGLRTAR